VFQVRNIFHQHDGRMKRFNPFINAFSVVFVLLYLDYMFDILASNWRSYFYQVEIIMLMVYYFGLLKKK